jgi:Domain of unknown function (DUF4416)
VAPPLRRNDRALLVVAAFSRHSDALDWAAERLQLLYGTIVMTSPDYTFDHTAYYEKTMGSAVTKRFYSFDGIRDPDILPVTKRQTIALEQELIETKKYPEPRPLNLDPGLLFLGKFCLATTKDQSHRIYLQNGIYAEVTLRYTKSEFEPWSWTYADYREPVVHAFLAAARERLYNMLQVERLA